MPLRTAVLENKHCVKNMNCDRNRRISNFLDVTCLQTISMRKKAESGFLLTELEIVLSVLCICLEIAQGSIKLRKLTLRRGTRLCSIELHSFPFIEYITIYKKFK
ncbi:unnamed protein product [Brugia pahangi]|uniref:Prepilin-type N-terminal cleavage/methylation domain-containing protein n=1 Tax=Brugia pahangi TaxID=6280 RepID=A0A0N4SXY9_BRUPA|nr:unnamed protein product [Brugia pahangi]